MNPVAMTIINPRKEYWPSRESNQRPPVIKSATLPTELRAQHILKVVFLLLQFETLQKKNVCLMPEA